MATQLKWSKAEKQVITCCISQSYFTTVCLQAQLESAKRFLQGMGYKAHQELKDLSNINLSYTEAQNYLKTFKAFDKDGDGHIR